MQQLREAWAYQEPHRFLLFDRDAKFGADVVSAVRDMGSEPTRTAFRSPWQNGVAERWVGSCRRDLLDHVIVLNERHLKRLMSSYLLYYHEDRTHLGLAKTRQQVVHRKSLCGWKQDSILSETRRAAPSLCGGSVDSRAIVLKTKLFSCTRPRHGSHFLRAFLTGRRFTAIPNRRAYADEKEILLMWCTTIWRTIG